MREEWTDILSRNEARILRRVSECCSRSPSGCLIWLGANTFGYPVINIKTSLDWKTVRVSRLLMALLGKLDISDDAQGVCHRCDTPSCLEIEHLFVGSQVDNMQDASQKGRIKTPSLYGEDHPRSRLTNDQVNEIRMSYLSQRRLAAKFGVSRGAIQSVQTGLTWKY
jgi:hypothetical protein